MGTKRALAPTVSEVIRRAQPGTLLDAFSGMCSVGEAVGEARQVWNNDVQKFASEVAKALFVARDAPLSALECGDTHFPKFKSQRTKLNTAFARSLEAEQALLETTSYRSFARQLATLMQTLRTEQASCRLRTPHLFAKTYAGTYFGVAQAIEIDSIVNSVLDAKKTGATSSDQSRWETVALGRTLLKVANSTGHFAQYLKPKKDTFQRYIALRKRSVWAEWLVAISEISPIGRAEWRTKNKAFNRDSLDLIPYLARKRSDLGVIYADPPYTDDQYSRYYHILETLCLYDYPTISGTGLYRPGRFQTPFSLRSSAPKALSDFVARCAATGADLVLSYPTNGLAVEAGLDIRKLLRSHYRRVELCHSVAHNHSTFGASKGQAKSQATELIYLAKSA